MTYPDPDSIDEYQTIKAKYRQVVSTWAEISKDNANRYSMFEDEGEVINFDLVERVYKQELSKTLSCNLVESMDGLANVEPHTFSLVEFKHGKFSYEELNDKILNSLLVLCDILHKNISDLRNHMDLIFVCNDNKGIDIANNAQRKIQESISRSNIEKAIFKKAKKEPIRYRLKKYQGMYFRNVHTYTETEFSEYMQQQRSNAAFK